MIATDNKSVTACDYVSKAIDDFIYIKGIVNKFRDIDSVYKYLSEIEEVKVFNKNDYSFEFSYSLIVGEIERDPFTDYPLVFNEYDIYDEKGNFIARRANDFK